MEMSETANIGPTSRWAARDEVNRSISTSEEWGTKNAFVYLTASVQGPFDDALRESWRALQLGVREGE